VQVKCLFGIWSADLEELLYQLKDWYRMTRRRTP